MNQQNKARILIQAIKEIAKEDKIKAQFLSYDWIVRLEKNKKIKHIWGYSFELNSAASQIISGDKSATSDLLKINKVPCAQHKLFLNPSLDKYAPHTGNWEEILKYFKKNNNKIIVKPGSDTSGGSSVFRAESKIELEKAIHKLFSNHRSICLSPFYKIKNEYRLIVLDGKAKLLYKKEIPCLRGDGKTNIVKLFLKKFKDKEGALNLMPLLNPPLRKGRKEKDENNLFSIPKKGEIIKLNWKHNLKFGASPEIIENQALKDKLENIATKASKAININFASVDIVEVGNQFLVLEINAGVMMEAFGRISDKNYKIAKDIYREAILKMF